MSNEELSKYLENTKVYVAGKSKEIQEKLFSLGYGWSGNSIHSVAYVNCPYLYMYKNHTIKYGREMKTFYDEKDGFREVTVDDILAYN